MLHGVIVITLCGALSGLAPASSSDRAVQTNAPAGQTRQESDAPKPTHAVRGIVKAVSAATIVITTGSGRRVHELTFVLTPTTHHEGAPALGSTVSIRYRVDHDALIATAISVQP